MKGPYRGKELPRILHLSIARYNRDLPKEGEDLPFLVSIHEEGTGITWQMNLTVGPETERFFIEKTQDLYLWCTQSQNAPLTPEEAQEQGRQLGAKMYETFIGTEGEKVLHADKPPTAVLLNVDETIMNLPWELMGPGGKSLAQQHPFGRLVTTRTIPCPTRDPSTEDKNIRMLAVINPTPDLGAGERQIKVFKEMEKEAKDQQDYSVEVTVLSNEKATRKAFQDMVAGNDFDIIHFTGHGSFDRLEPETSALRFVDGPLTAKEVLDLQWKKPPGLVFNCACESGRAAPGRRLASTKKESNGLAAAFITAGTSTYAGFFWPVTISGANKFTTTFYKYLFDLENIGKAFLEARKQTGLDLYGPNGDLTGYSAVLYGDAASDHRPDTWKNGN